MGPDGFKLLHASQIEMPLNVARDGEELSHLVRYLLSK